MKKLIIAEKPSLAKEIVNAIGHMNREGDYYENNEYIVVSVFGHLLTLWDLDKYLGKEEKSKWELSDLNYFPERFRFKVKDDKGIRERYKLIKKLIARNDVDTIVNAGDADREGEVLINIVVYSIFNQLNIKKRMTRIWLDDQTDITIRKELNHPRDISETENLYNEGLCRTYIDWLYGIYLTRYISIKSKTKMPTGRVIIPAVKFVYDRCDEIKNFVPKDYYKITCPIRTNNGEELKLDFKEMKFEIDEKYEADNLVRQFNDKPIIVTSIEKKDVVKQPKRLFSLASLQNYMSKYNKWSLEKTLNVLQSLYEKKYTTYPRTNTEYLADKEKDKINNIISAVLKSELIKNYHCENINLVAQRRLFDSSKVESHSAITITTKIPENYAEFNQEEQLLYRIILNRCLANFCDEKCVIAETKITFSFNAYDKAYTTTIKGQTISQMGYLVFENDIKSKSLYQFSEGANYYCKPILEKKKTTPPTNVTEEEINKFFENPFRKQLNDDVENTDEDYKNILNGVEIGTVATRGSTLEKIKNEGYISMKKNSLIITEKGIAFINILYKLNINLWAERTAMLSQELKKIYKGQRTIEGVVASAEDEIKEIISQNIDISEEVNNAKEVIGECPLCHKPVYENKKGYGCSGYKDGCKFVIWKKIAGKNITKNNASDLLNPQKHSTRKLKGFKSKNGKEFSAKLLLNADGSVGFDFN